MKGDFQITDILNILKSTKKLAKYFIIHYLFLFFKSSLFVKPPTIT